MEGKAYVVKDAFSIMPGVLLVKGSRVYTFHEDDQAAISRLGLIRSEAESNKPTFRGS